jgi:hypothetical protein
LGLNNWKSHYGQPDGRWFLLHSKKDVELNETTVKYLSGLLDADGTVSFDFRNEARDNGKATLALKVGISGSDAVDKHGFIERLPEITSHGTTSRHGDKSQYVYWIIQSRRDLEMMVPRLLKHMCVKAKHLQRMFEKWKELRGTSLSAEQCQELRAWSKQSRYDAGPLKPKNHPSWAWTGGYLDGNGHYMFSLANKGAVKETRSMRVSACCHKGDSAVLEFLHKAFGGKIRTHPATENAMIWDRNLGLSQRSFALEFLGNVVRFSQLKRHRIEQMIAFHHQQRLNIPTPAGEAIV